MNFILSISYHSSQSSDWSQQFHVLCSLEMKTLCCSSASPVHAQYGSSSPANNFFSSALALPSLKSSAFSKNRAKPRAGVTKASIAVEQQTQQTKVALIRIGTRGRYSFSPFLRYFCFWVSSSSIS